MTATADIRADSALERGFRLGELRIAPQDGEISGPGSREQLDPKVMAVLVLLARHAGHVVTREDLLSQLWPNAVVTDDVLSRCIYELRRQLSQAGGDEQFKAIIETVPKRGYRLSHDVTALESQVQARSPRHARRFALTIAAAVAVITALWFASGRQAVTPGAGPGAGSATKIAASIAVLPFVDLSQSRDQTYLSDGLAEEIIDRLAMIRELRVIARTSSFVFRDQTADVPEIAAKLDVSHLLEGSVRRSGNRIRVSAQLIETASNSHLWSKTYDRSLGDLFEVQDEIAAAVAAALNVTPVKSTGSAVQAVDESAHQLLLQGRFLQQRRGPGDLALSARYYRDALAIQPDYAEAWAELAASYYLMADSGEMTWSEARAGQYEAAQRAIEFDPGMAQGHLRLAQYYFEGGDLAAARKHFRAAGELDSRLARASNVDDPTQRREDRIRTGIEEARLALVRDPLSAVAHANLGVFLLAAEQLDEAESEMRKALQLSPTFGADLEIDIARIQVLKGRPADAYAIVRRLPAGVTRDEGLALLSDGPDLRPEADAALARLAARHPPDALRSMRLADAYAWRGKTEEAIATLQRYRDSLDPADGRTLSRIWWNQQEMMVSPFLKPLYADPRWQTLMAWPG